MFGVLNVYKPKGKTSHDVVAILRRVTKIKQIGHTGTLDPFAEGVLPVCIGKATRLIEYFKDDKSYIGTVQFGKSTTTYDIEGEIVDTSDKKVSKQDVESMMLKFHGEIEQFPPIYSAIKVNGKKLYEYARNGEDVDIKPRNVIINKFELINFDRESQTAEILIECSKGTYIRSLAHDLGKELGCFGHLIKLVRIKAGDFLLEDSINLEELDSKDNVLSKITYPLGFLDYPKYELNIKEKELVSHGVSIRVPFSSGICILVSEGQLAAVAVANAGVAKLSKVFI